MTTQSTPSRSNVIFSTSTEWTLLWLPKKYKVTLPKLHEIHFLSAKLWIRLELLSRLGLVYIKVDRIWLQENWRKSLWVRYRQRISGNNRKSVGSNLSTGWWMVLSASDFSCRTTEWPPACSAFLDPLLDLPRAWGRTTYVTVPATATWSALWSFRAVGIFFCDEWEA